MNPSFKRFNQLINNPLKFKLFLLLNLPAAFFAGLRIQQFNAEKSIVKVRYNWFTKNPFKSMYFAVEAMAAELSTGLLVFGQVYHRFPKMSMLVVEMKVEFVKKATGTIQFTCEEGLKIQEAVNQSIADGEGKIFTITSIGANAQNETVAIFRFTWSVKAKQ
jgi:hypothetical protein